jgi:hypothetical protein
MYDPSRPEIEPFLVSFIKIVEPVSSSPVVESIILPFIIEGNAFSEIKSIERRKNIVRYIGQVFCESIAR